MSDHRLIYADELYDTLANKLTWLMNYGYDVYLKVGKNIREVIDEQPTAYDIDKVVEQLEELIEKNVGFMRATPEANAYIKAIRDAIEIVKGGAE